MLELVWDRKGIIHAEGDETVEKLRKNFFGAGEKPELHVEEALYLMNFQNAVCKDLKKSSVTFNEMASSFSKGDPRFFIKYNAYRDWRDRGLILRRVEEYAKKGKSAKSIKKYPSQSFQPLQDSIEIVWYPKSLFSIVDNKEIGKMLFNEYWLGQYGIYKQDRGDLLKLSFLETLFLARHFNTSIINSETGKKVTYANILRHVIKEREYAKQLYDVYEDWRLRGYVVKTGFKFGSHFRIYFPGASPAKGGKWVHSRHVLHVFPKEQKMLISEWSRAVRVAHGVKKTFLLGIPEMTTHDYRDCPADFLAYRRKKEKNGWVRETPHDKPRYLLVAVGEDEHIGGVELASLLKKAQDMGVELLLSITDRETSITYYVLKKVMLPDSRYEYYEIEWMKP
jgi:tRNA-intron endonuclease